MKHLSTATESGFLSNRCDKWFFYVKNVRSNSLHATEFPQQDIEMQGKKEDKVERHIGNQIMKGATVITGVY